MTETKRDPPTPAEMIEIFASHLNRTSLCNTKEDFEETIWLIRHYCNKLEESLEEEE